MKTPREAAHEDTVSHSAVAWCGWGRGHDVHSSWCHSRTQALASRDSEHATALAHAEGRAKELEAENASLRERLRAYKHTVAKFCDAEDSDAELEVINELDALARQSPAEPKAAPVTCKAWCGTVRDLLWNPGHRRSGEGPFGRVFCTEACRDTSRPLIPAPRDNPTAQDETHEFHCATQYRNAHGGAIGLGCNCRPAAAAKPMTRARQLAVEIYLRFPGMNSEACNAITDALLAHEREERERCAAEAEGYYGPRIITHAAARIRSLGDITATEPSEPKATGDDT